MINELVKELQKSDKRLFIQTHDFPDPDAVASAYGLQSYLNHYNIDSQIVYCGDIQRDALKNMINKLEIEITRASELKFLDDDLIIIVDGCKWSKNVTDLPGFEIAVIDHHIVEKPEDVPYIQIDHELGSCSTIITDYFIKQGLGISQKAATALKIGISRDTDLLTRKVTQKDIDSYHYLYNFADNTLVNTLLRNNIQLSDFAFFNQTISKLKTDKNIAWHYFNKGCETNLMGILGDFILSAQEIELSILFAKNDNVISISIRNENANWNAAEIIRSITQSIGAGGGHIEMAGGVIFSAKGFSLTETMHRVVTLLND
ncbi:MAG: DHH family phosphoesterase [Spirochaetaceae bacterium]